jgi:hypothetical protein
MKNFSEFVSKSTKLSQPVLFDLTPDQIREEYVWG